jgi:uncharacterized protein DUF7014/AbiJ-like protein
MDTRSRPVGITNIFSKRKAASAGQVPELQSSTLPEKFRGQVSHILLDTIGTWVNPPSHMPPDMVPRPSNQSWMTIYQRVIRELGVFQLGDGNDNPFRQCIHCLLTAETDVALDLIDVSLQYIDQDLRQVDSFYYERFAGVRPNPDAAIEEFNTRCRENGVGYAYEDGYIVPVSSSFVHTEVVEPAFRLLNVEEFAGAHEEFVNAHRRLRAGDYKNAIVDAAKAFESTMKTICSRRGWKVEPGATAKKLIETLLKNGFIEPYLETQLAHLRGLLETGVPVIRNKDAAHGQGEDPVEVPRELAEYAIHLTAANIVFLVKRFKA